MRRRRTVPNEKELAGLYCGGKIPRTKTIPELRLTMERRPLGDLSRANV